jgi:hypothetical protein
VAVAFWCVPVPAQQAVQRGSEEQETSGIFPIAGSHLLKEREEEVGRLFALHPELRTALRKTAAWAFSVGSQATWYADRFTNNTRYQVPSTCRAVGTSCYLFVEDASWTNGRVNQAVLDSVVRALDAATPANPSAGIFQTDIAAFGSPPDVDHDSRIVVLLLDIVDGFSGTGGYIAGYFTSFNEVPKITPGFSTSNEAEIYFLDVNPANLTTPGGLRNGLATTAHEFQHMIHFNYDPTEITFVNECLSEVAEVICGYPLRDQSGYVNETNHYLFDWRGTDNTLVLRDYSRASRFALYLRDQFGTGVFKPVVQSAAHGIAGIDQGLSALVPSTSRRFAGVFQDWLVANALDDTGIDPRYGYQYPSLLKAVPKVFASPDVASTTDTVQNLGGRYLAFAGGNGLHVTFSSSSLTLVIKAVETGQVSKRVLPVTLGVQFNEPEFGTTYSSVSFVVMNTSTTTPAVFQYVSRGGTTSATDEGPALPAQAGLEQNYPNPFNPSTTIGYAIASTDQGPGSEQAGSGSLGLGSSWVRLIVYDLLGREVAVLVNEKQAPGRYSVTWNSRGLASGVYVCRLLLLLPDAATGMPGAASSGGQLVQSRTLVLLR